MAKNDDTEIDIDDPVPVSQPRVSWFDLTLDDKKLLLRRTGLVNGVYADGSRSALPLLDIEKAEPLFHGLDLFNAELSSESVRSYREFNMIQRGWTQASAEIGSPWISASVKYREEESKGHTSKTEQIYTTATYRMPTYQAQIIKEEAASALYGAFLTSVKKATEDEKPFQALQKVFENYGYIFQLKVELGASLTVSATQTNDESVKVADSKSELEAEVSGKYGAFTAGAAFGKGNEQESKEVLEKQVGTLKINVNGGDKKLLTDTKRWLETTEDVNRMTIIWTSEVVTVTDLIQEADKDLYEKIQKVFGEPLIGRWVPVTYRGSTHDFTLHVGFPDPYWSRDDGWCVIGDSLGYDVVLLVKDAPGHSGGLGTCTFKEDDIRRITYKTDGQLDYDLAIRQAVADSDAYISIGAVIRRPTEFGHLDKGNPDSFRAIRKDLLVPATYAFDPTTLLSPQEPIDRTPVQGWKIIPKDSSEGIETNFFWPGSSDGQRDTMLKEGYPLFVLKKNAIKILNTPEQALDGIEEMEKLPGVIEVVDGIEWPKDMIEIVDASV